MKTRVLLLALAAASLSPLAAQAQQAMVAAQSEVSFTSRQMGVPVDGRFKSFSAQVAFDPAKLATSSIAFSVDTGSADISREANAELPKATWFNVAAFPKATFQSSAIKRIDTTRYEVAGKLSIKGVSSDVVVPVTLAQNGATTTATGTFPIKRLTFRIGEKEWADTSMVADEVQVRFKIALTGVPKL
jgi:polyisoprenoid-binding protein YceI